MKGKKSASTYKPEALERALAKVRALANKVATTRDPAERSRLDGLLDRWNSHLSALDRDREVHFRTLARDKEDDQLREAAKQARWMGTGPGAKNRFMDAEGRITETARAERHRLIMRRMWFGLDSLTPDQLALTKLRDVGEDLWIRAALDKPGADGPERTLSVRQRKMWQDWQTRALANPLSLTVDADGGALVPTDFVADVFRDMAMSGPMLDPACANQVVTSTGRDLPWPTETGSKTREVVRLTAGVDMSARTTDFGQVVLKGETEWGDLFAIPWTLFQDAAVPLEQLLRKIMVEAGVRGLNKQFTVGDNLNGNPEGLTQNTIKVTVGTAVTRDGVETKLQVNDALSAVHDIDPIYRSSSKCLFQLHDTAVELFRKQTVDAGQGYVWQTDARSGVPATLFGYPVKVNQAFQTLAGSALVGCFGDMDAYAVRLVSGMSLKRLDEVSALARQHVLQYVLRADGRYLSKDRITIIKAAA